jgi:hypothetical protein
MRQIITAVLLSLLAAVALAADDPPTRYMDLVNRTHDSVTAVEIAAAGSEAFRPEPLAGRLRGGGGSTTIAVTGEDCVVDVRLTFRDGRTLTERGVDLCRSSGLRIERLPRVDESRPALALQASG